MKSGFTIRAQPRRILAQELRNRVRKNRTMDSADKAVGYRIGRETLKDESTKVLYCTEAVVSLMMHRANSRPQKETFGTCFFSLL